MQKVGSITEPNTYFLCFVNRLKVVTQYLSKREN